MRTFTFAAATLIGYTQALRLAAKASHADLIFAEFEAKHNKNYLSQQDRETRKELYLKKHEEIVKLHPRTSQVGDNYLNDLTPEELDHMHGIDTASHQKSGPPKQRTAAQIESDEDWPNPHLTFTYENITLEARITDNSLDGNTDDNTDDTTPIDDDTTPIDDDTTPIDDDTTPIDDDTTPIDDDTTPIDDDTTPIDDDSTFPLSPCPANSTECNWLALGAVSPVKNQGGCGSCWSFAAAGMAEASYYIKNGDFSSTETHVDLSEQQDVDCIFGHGGCQGGNSYDSWNLHAEQAAVQKPWALEEDYPYKATFQGDASTCDFNRGVFVDSSTYHVGDWESLQAVKDALLNGPVVIYLWASDTVFTNYTGGVITDNCYSDSVNHAVLAVGFGHDAEVGEDYFLVKNSWGPSWGRDGYIKLGHREGNGVCGMQYWNHYQIEVGSSVGL